MIKKQLYRQDTEKNTATQRNRRGCFEKAPDYFRILFCLYLIMTLFLMIFMDKRLHTSFTPNILEISNMILILPALLLFFGLCCFCAWHANNPGDNIRTSLSERQFYSMIGIYFVLVFLGQLFLTDHIHFKTGWDAGVLTQTAERLAFHPSDPTDDFTSAYFGSYPNNLALLNTLVIFYRLGRLLLPSKPYIFILFLTNLTVCSSVFLAVLCIYKMTKNRCVTVVGMLAGSLLIAYSPWIEIPYTDALGMIFPTTIFFCFLFVKKPLLRYSMITFFGVLGYFYKPTVLIPLIALVILGLCSGISALQKKKFSCKRLGCLLLATAIMAGCSFSVHKVLLLQNQFPINEHLEKTMEHYFMMGLNTEAEGVYNQEDVAYSDFFPNVKSRKKANLNVCAERLQNMGLGGLGKHLIKKTLLNYNDGTFSFGREGNFYSVIPAEHGSLDRILRQIFYTDGKHYQILATTEHIIWLFVLLGVCFCLIPISQRYIGENYLALTLLGVSLFLLLFECRARYLYLFTPLYLILSCCGLMRASSLLSRLRRDRFGGHKTKTT